MKLLIAIVENEKAQSDITAAFCQRYANEHISEIQTQTYVSGFDFLEADGNTFDCVFMDIDMPGINGMDTSRKLREKNQETEIVFVTNLPQYAIDGYKVHALDFILKPMTYADFSLVMDKLVSMKEKEEDTSFVLNIHGTIRKLHANDILFVEMVKHDVYIHLTNDEPISFRGSIKALEDKIQDENFFKCNSGIIINLGKIQTVDGDVCVLETGERLNISRSRKKELMMALAHYYSHHRKG